MIEYAFELIIGLILFCYILVIPFSIFEDFVISIQDKSFIKFYLTTNLDKVWKKVLYYTLTSFTLIWYGLYLFILILFILVAKLFNILIYKPCKWLMCKD